MKNLENTLWGNSEILENLDKSNNLEIIKDSKKICKSKESWSIWKLKKLKKSENLESIDILCENRWKL